MDITKPDRALLDRVQRTLGKLLDAQEPPTTRTETLRKAGITRSAYNSAMSRGSLRVLWLFRILRICKTDLAEFFAEALAGDDPPDPPELQIARNRVDEDGGEDLPPGDRTPSAAGDGAPDELAELETLSQERPAEAVARARELVETVPLEQLPRVLAFCGTAYRFQEQYGQALAVLHQAKEWERDPILKADCNQRLAYVYGVLPGDGMERARQFLEEAQAEYVLQGMDSKVGETLVDRAMHLYHQGSKELATVYNQRALEFLTPDATDHLFTAHLGLALCGQNVEANLAKAEGFPVSSVHRCKLIWFRAELQEREGNYSEAFLTMVGLALTYLGIQQNLNACWAACEAARLSRLAPVDMGKLADIIGKISFALPDDSRAGSALARLWVAMTSSGKKQKLLPLMVAVREAVKRERLAAARAL
jgi:tetratricopeptide (TPR) repeat protein